MPLSLGKQKIVFFYYSDCLVAYLCTQYILSASHNKGKVCQPPLVLLWATPTTHWPNTLPQCSAEYHQKHACSASHMYLYVVSLCSS